MLRYLIRSFLYDNGEPPLIDGTGIATDPVLAERNAARQAECRAKLGDKWICANPRQRHDREDFDARL